MKKILLVALFFIAFLSVKAQDTTYVYSQNTFVRIDNLENVPIFLTHGSIAYRLRGADFVLTDGITKKSYNIGAYSEIFNQDTIGFATQEAAITYLNKFLNNSDSYDKITLATKVIDFETEQINIGTMYRSGFQKDIPNGDSAIFTITTPDTTKWCYFTPNVDGENEFRITFYEDTARVGITGGSSIIPANTNRNSTDTSGCVCVSDPVFDATGLKVLGNVVFGSGKSSGGTGAPANEWVLKQNATYVILVINQTTSANQVNIRANWFEHVSEL